MVKIRRTLLLSSILVAGGSLLAACDGTTVSSTPTQPATSPTATASPTGTPATTTPASTPATTTPTGTPGSASPPVTVAVKVWFLDRARAQTGEEPLFRPVSRQVRPPAVAARALDALFAGPAEAEKASGLELTTSGATGYSNLHIQNGIAYVTLQGGCSSGGSTMTIAGEIMPTLRQFASVTYVKIYAPDGTTERPTGASDSIPLCLEP